MEVESYIFVKQGAAGYFTRSGCSEFPAHYPDKTNYSSMLLYLFGDSCMLEIGKVLNVFWGKDYKVQDYMSDYVDFIMNILQPINVIAKKTLFEPYTVAMLSRDINKRRSPAGYEPCVRRDPSDLTNNGKYMISAPGICQTGFIFEESDVIGISTNGTEIREATKAGASLCRKTQIAHTILRMGYSDGWQLPMIAMLIHKNFGIHPFYSLWIATWLKGIFNTSSQSYGSWFSTMPKFISYEEFIKNFFDSKLNNSVMKHFLPTPNILEEYCALPAGGGIDTIDNWKTLLQMNSTKEEKLSLNSLSGVLDMLTIPRIGQVLNDVINRNLDKSGEKFTKVEFIFERKLFSSVAIGPKYKGVLIPESRLGRIIFKDENEIMLSIMKTSKFIKLKEE